MKISDILPIAILGGIGITAYMFITGKWKLPGIPGVDEQTLSESGVPGVIGDMIYNITYPTELRESATQPGGDYYEGAKTEITNILPPGETPTQEQIVPRAVATGVSEDIIGGGLLKALLLSPVTIGAGLGAITQQERYYASLPEDSKTLAIRKTVATRELWKQEHIGEYIGASALSWMFPPAAIVGKAAELHDMARAAKPVTHRTYTPSPKDTTIPHTTPVWVQPTEMVSDTSRPEGSIGGR